MNRKNCARKGNTTRAKFRRALAYQGLCSTVARELGLSPSHVYRVAKGDRVSRKVEQALVREIERIDRESAA